MDTPQLKEVLARIKELDTVRNDNPRANVEQELGGLVIEVIEDFLVDHKRQTELLEGIANTAEFFEIQRREGRG